MNRIIEKEIKFDNQKTDCLEIKTTFDKKEDAIKMAEILLDKKLIACGQISVIESHYVWKDKREIANEFLLTMKTRQSLYESIEHEIKENHSYDCPEIIASKIEEISDEYYNWLLTNTKN